MRERIDPILIEVTGGLPSRDGVVALRERDGHIVRMRGADMCGVKPQLQNAKIGSVGANPG